MINLAFVCSVFRLSYPGAGRGGRPHGSPGEGNLEQQGVRQQERGGNPGQHHRHPHHPLHLRSDLPGVEIQQGGS